MEVDLHVSPPCCLPGPQGDGGRLKAFPLVEVRGQGFRYLNAACFGGGVSQLWNRIGAPGVSYTV